MPPEDQHLYCPLCGQSHSEPVLQRGQRALCVRCGATLSERGRLGPRAALVFALTGLVLAIPSLLLPFVTLAKLGHERISLLSGGFAGLLPSGWGLAGVWVLFCGIIAPFALLALLVAIFWSDRRENLRVWNKRLRRVAHGVEFWSMPEVQVLGVLVGFFKLADVVQVTVGPGLWCYAAASVFSLLAWRRFELQSRQERTFSIPASASANTRPTLPARTSTGQAAALAIAALVMMVPAYALPVMHLGMLGQSAADTTILSGIARLWEQDLGGLAAIVFTASFLVPMLKLGGLAWLLASARRQPPERSRRLARLHGAIDFIGRWSMLDVFLVAFLAGAVQFGRLALVQPRIGISAFGTVVVLTMLATHRFDPRIFWEDPPPAGATA